MIDSGLALLESLHLVGEFRSSAWLYPLVNTAHILGIALLVGGIVPLDLRLLGFWRAQSLGPLWHVLTRCAGVGLLLAVVSGFLLFSTRATEYAGSALFLTKMLLIVAGVLNVLVVHRLAAARRPSVPWPLKLGAGLSLTVWVAVLTLGRLVGYF